MCAVWFSFLSVCILVAAMSSKLLSVSNHVPVQNDLPIVTAMHSVNHYCAIFGLFTICGTALLDHVVGCVLSPKYSTAKRNFLNVLIILSVLVPYLWIYFYAIPRGDYISFLCCNNIILCGRNNMIGLYLAMYGGAVWRSELAVLSASLMTLGGMLKVCALASPSSQLHNFTLSAIVFYNFGAILAMYLDCKWYIALRRSNHGRQLTVEQYSCGLYILAYLLFKGFFIITNSVLRKMASVGFDTPENYWVCIVYGYAFFFVVLVIFQKQTMRKEVVFSEVRTLHSVGSGDAGLTCSLDVIFILLPDAGDSGIQRHVC